MKLKKPNILRYTDTWGGRNYGCYPINTEGQSLKYSIDSSKLWSLLKTKVHIDERNDNQCDIDRGSDFTYEHSTSGEIINIYMSKSRSGKTINWEFHCFFTGNIEF